MAIPEFFFGTFLSEKSFVGVALDHSFYLKTLVVFTCKNIHNLRN
jgi:hypothetical protein